jgi:ribosomal protein L37E
MTAIDCMPVRDETTTVPCRNEGCGKRAESGEAYCAECGLERSLFRRERRFETAQRPESPARRPGAGSRR